MYVAHLLRKTLPLTLLAICACGSDKTTATVGSTVVRLADGAASCPAGGEVLSYGVDKNGNGTLDDAEIAGNFDVCKGARGSVTKVSTVAPGAQCAQGGALVQIGVDANGNGVLDDAEITSQTPICSADGMISSVIGSLSLTTQADFLKYANVETVSGGLSVTPLPDNSSFTMTKLRSVGGDLNVAGSGNNGLPLLSAEKAPARALLSPYPKGSVQVSFPVLASIGGGVYLASCAFSVPALTTIGGYFGADWTTLSAPALTTVGGGMNCNDPNAVLPQLTSVGSLGNNCGAPDLIEQITVLTQSYYPSYSNTTLAKLTKIVGSTNYTDGQLVFNPYSPQSLDAPLLTDVGTLYLYDYSSQPTLNFPMLERVGALNMTYYRWSGGTLAPILVAPHLAGVLGYVNAGSRDPSIVESLPSIGGALVVSGSGYTTLDANVLTSVAALGVHDNSYLTRFTAKSLTSMPAWDPNYMPFNPPLVSLNNLSINCSPETPVTDKRCNSIFITNNSALTTVDLGPLTTVPGALFLVNDPSLTSFTSAVTSVGSAWSFQDHYVNATVNASVYVSNTGLASLAGLRHITSTPGRLVVTSNSNLTDVSGLALTGSADTCPIFLDNPNLDFCAAQHALTAYNAACTLTGAPGDNELKDPCAAATCAQGQSCTVDCTQQNGYACH